MSDQSPNEAVSTIVRINREIQAEIAVIPGRRHTPDTLLTTQHLADLLSVSPRTVESWRQDGRGPEITRITGMPRYKYSDVVDWILAQNPEAMVWQNLRDEMDEWRRMRDGVYVPQEKPLDED